MGARPYFRPAIEGVVRKFNSGATWQELTK